MLSLSSLPTLDLNSAQYRTILSFSVSLHFGLFMSLIKIHPNSTVDRPEAAPPIRFGHTQNNDHCLERMTAAYTLSLMLPLLQDVQKAAHNYKMKKKIHSLGSLFFKF